MVFRGPSQLAFAAGTCDRVLQTQPDGQMGKPGDGTIQLVGRASPQGAIHFAETAWLYGIVVLLCCFLLHKCIITLAGRAVNGTGNVVFVSAP